MPIEFTCIKFCRIKSRISIDMEYRDLSTSGLKVSVLECGAGMLGAESLTDTSCNIQLDEGKIPA